METDNELLKTKKIKKPRDISKLLLMFVIPIITVSLFFVILISAISGPISNIFTMLDDMENIRQQVEDANADILNLQKLNQAEDQIKADLASVNKIAPAGITEVVFFQQKIADLAQANSLNIVKSDTGEEVLAVEGENPVLGINEIPSIFVLSGRLTNIKSFINQIKTLEDFVIIGEMEIRVLDKVDLRNISDNLQWNLEITLIKYQFQQPNAQNQLSKAYLQVPPTIKINAKILQFIREKFPVPVSQ